MIIKHLPPNNLLNEIFTCLLLYDDIINHSNNKLNGIKSNSVFNKTRCQQFKISATISSLTSKHSFTSYRPLCCFTSANAASFFFSQEPSVILVKCFLGQNMRVRPSGDYFTRARTCARTHTHTLSYDDYNFLLNSDPVQS